ncbi:hypothetical protein SAMN02745883_01317 [Caminicella sporogenes DSM 14501]|uniref:Uncharacterized protein n=1 Tax=Caminicella sporogenes DSM 14501 TaxID=1121266 RepID=A0A1M6PUL5_9FIRM|nr:hypothetical protein [Caminicella sporogenes]RKD21967.1 hypothetical protein BET04_06870 [Caminicella sporogenes]SHK11631.1 hypothetical protein SAMN02745883_01317 [Caminicella sporogenes DSM 14501]
MLFRYVLEVLFLAVTIAFLGAWGIVKQQNKGRELIQRLFLKIQKKVIKELKIKGSLNIKEIEKIIKNTKASLFWSRDKVKVVEPKLLAKQLVEYMLENEIIKEKNDKGRKVYILYEDKK